MALTPDLPEAPLGRPSLSHRLAQPTTAIAIAYVSSIFISAMDLQVVNVALPSLGRDLHEPLSSVQWTVIAYVLSLAVFIPASGWIGDRVGTKRTFLFALGMFTGASALCGVAQSLGELVGARALQGVGGGMLIPTGTAMLFRAYPPAQRARVTRTLLVPILLAPGVAPIIGGVLTETLSWRWVFFINLPIGLVTFAYGLRYLVEETPSPTGRLDVRGLLLSGLGLSAVLYAVSEGSVQGWGSAPILGAAGGGILSLAIFVRLALRQPDPLLRLNLLRDRLFRSTNVVIGLASGAFLGSLYLIPVFLQQVLHQSPIGSGTTTFLEAIGVGVASQSLGRLYPRLGPRVMAGCGGVSLAIILTLFVFVDQDTSLWLIRLLLFLLGASNSATFLSVQSSIFTTISHADLGHASAIYNTQRQASAAVSIAILTTVVAGVGHPLLTAFHAAFVAAAAMAALGAICALVLITTEDARASMAPARDRAGRH